MVFVYRVPIFNSMLLWNTSLSCILFFDQKTSFTQILCIDLLKVLGNLINVIFISFVFWLKNYFLNCKIILLSEAAVEVVFMKYLKS